MLIIGQQRKAAGGMPAADDPLIRAGAVLALEDALEQRNVFDLFEVLLAQCERLVIEPERVGSRGVDLRERDRGVMDRRGRIEWRGTKQILEEELRAVESERRAGLLIGEERGGPADVVQVERQTEGEELAD